MLDSVESRDIIFNVNQFNKRNFSHLVGCCSSLATVQQESHPHKLKCPHLSAAVHYSKRYIPICRCWWLHLQLIINKHQHVVDSLKNSCNTEGCVGLAARVEKLHIWIKWPTVSVFAVNTVASQQGCNVDDRCVTEKASHCSALSNQENERPREDRYA